ncbi:MAG: hypothetical protein ACOYNC_19745 [Bacteroidales bacterium]
MNNLGSEKTLERITQYYMSDKTKLSRRDNHIRVRWETAYSMLINQNGVELDVVRMLMKFYGISKMQAYRDVYNCTRCFGLVGGMDRQFIRHMVTQWAIESLRQAEQLNDFDAIDRFLNIIIKANNLDKEDIDIPDPSKIQPPVQLLSVNYSFLKSEYFKLIDPKAQKALLNLHKQVVALIDASPIAHYKEILLAACDPTEEAYSDLY